MRWRPWPRRHWLLAEERALGARDTVIRIVSRHWTHAGACTAAKMAADHWRDMRGEVRAGRARWDEMTDWVRRWPGGIQSMPTLRARALARLPKISYYVIPREAEREVDS